MAGQQLTIRSKRKEELYFMKTASYGLLWFGAGLSLAEILIGTEFAPLGFTQGLAAIFLGHCIGCFLLFWVGLIGAKTRLGAMETVKRSFGQKGSLCFSILNVVQLLGWTGIMIYQGSQVANALLPWGSGFWALIIGILIIVWLAIGLKKLTKINWLAMLLLFVLTLFLSKTIIQPSSAGLTFEAGLSFGAAVELAAAMPVSWLPLISDYTKEAEKPLNAALVSTLVYGLTSCWMYAIGLGAALWTGTSEIAPMLQQAGSGLVGIIIVVFATVTTTFLDAYSTGISGTAINARINFRLAAIVVTILGTLSAIFYPLESLSNFLYFIGSVFAPMAAILIADYFILHQNYYNKNWVISRLIIFIIGFIAYRYLMQVDLIIGNTLPDMLFTLLLTVGVGKIQFNKQISE